MTTISSFSFCDKIVQTCASPNQKLPGAALFVVVPLAMVLTPLTLVADLAIGTVTAAFENIRYGNSDRRGEILFSKFVISPIQHVVFAGTSLLSAAIVFKISLIAAPLLALTPVPLAVGLFLLTSPWTYRLA